MLRRRVSVVVAASLVVATFAASSPSRADHVAHRFEPTDLDLQPPGLLQFDLQAGLVKGPSAVRVVTPDFEVNFGVARDVELDLDGAASVQGPSDGSFRLRYVTQDNLWVSSKIGLASWHDDARRSSWALGLQLGPKVAVMESAHGAGFESLFLVGRNLGRVHLVFNVGGLVDPGAEVSRERPIGLEAGADLNLDLNDDDTFSILGELGGVLYVSSDPSQATATLGLQWSPSELLDLSLVALVGAGGSDRYGVLLGISPKVRLFR